MHIPQKHTNSRAHYSVITQYTFNYRGLHILIEGIFPNQRYWTPWERRDTSSRLWGLAFWGAFEAIEARIWERSANTPKL